MLRVLESRINQFLNKNRPKMYLIQAHYSGAWNKPNGLFFPSVHCTHFVLLVQFTTF